MAYHTIQPVPISRGQVWSLAAGVAVLALAASWVGIRNDFAYDDKNAAEAPTEDQSKREQQRQAQDIRDLFNAWNSLDDEGEPDDLQGAEAWSQNECPSRH